MYKQSTTKIAGRWKNRLLLSTVLLMCKYIFDAMSIPGIGVTHTEELPLVFDDSTFESVVFSNG